MPGGMQAGMQPRIDMRILGCMHPGMPGVIKRTVFEIFDFKNAVTLKTGLRVREGL